MDFKKILARSWNNIWQYKVLWLFAIVVALTASSDMFLLPLWDTNGVSNAQVRFTDDFIVHLPGEGFIVDFTQPEGMRFFVTDGLSETDYEFYEWANANYPGEIEAVGITLLSLFLVFVLAAMLGSYVSQTALIHMVAETEKTGEKTSFFQGLRSGFSNRALRIFLIDFLFFLAVVGTFALEIYLVVVTYQVMDQAGFWLILGTSFLVAGVLFTTLMLFVLLGFFLSVIKPNVRRAIVMDDLSLFSALARGFKLLKEHFKDVGITWLIWIGTRILWLPVSIVVLLVLSPLLLIFLVAGVLVALLPGLLAAGIASLFVHWVGAAIIGVMVGLPFMVVVTVLPFLVVKGWVEIFKSSLWTYSYAELSAMKPVEKEAERKEPVLKTPKIASETA